MTDDTEYQDFPFEEIRKDNGEYFDSWAEAKRYGWDDDQIWSITISDEDEDFSVWSYGPPDHYVNHVGHVATKERHDNNTYYHEYMDLSEFR